MATYTIASGDTLNALAKKWGVTVQEILKANPQITNPDLIITGQTLNTPGTTPPPASGGGGTTTPAPTTPPPASATGGQVFTATSASTTTTATEGMGGVSILNGVSAWYRDPVTRRYYAVYTLPNSGYQIMFEATPLQMDAIFGVGIRPAFTDVPFDQLVAEPNRTFGGAIGEMEGSGSFTDLYKRTIATALDQGDLPEWAQNDPQAQELLFLATSENWTQERLLNEYAKLPSFQARYPNIQAFTNLNMTLTEAVTAFLEYEANLMMAVRASGGDENQVTPQLVSQIFQNGYSNTDVQAVFDAFQRMENHVPSLTAFNQVLAASGMQPMTSEEAFEFMAGNAPSEFYQLWESSSFSEAAANAGLGDLFSAEDAIRVAMFTPGFTQPSDAFRILSETAGALLRFRGEIDFNAYGLTADDLIDVHIGMAPRSGRSMAEVEENMNRAVQEAQASLQQRARPFIGFSQSGLPQSRSLTQNRQRR